MKNRNYIHTVLLAGGLALSSAIQRADAQNYRFTTFDEPLAAPGHTYAHAVSGANIVGYYGDTNGIWHGFIKSGDNYTTLDVPSASNGTYAHGISGRTVVGYFRPNGFAQGFIYDMVTGTYTTASDPAGVWGILSPPPVSALSLGSRVLLTRFETLGIG